MIKKLDMCLAISLGVEIYKVIKKIRNGKKDRKILLYCKIF